MVSRASVRQQIMKPGRKKKKISKKDKKNAHVRDCFVLQGEWGAERRWKGRHSAERMVCVQHCCVDESNHVQTPFISGRESAKQQHKQQVNALLSFITRNILSLEP